MPEQMALKIAVDLLHVPSQVRLIRLEPLPDGVLVLLRIAAGDEESERQAIELTGRSLDIIRKAAMFFIEQILFAPNVDSYRVLGTGPEATSTDLRRNVALLLRWLHPDLDPHGARSVFIGRVTAAWNNLKTPERRKAYDEEQQRSQQKTKSRSKVRRSKAGRASSGRDSPNNGSLRMRFAHRGPISRGGERIGLLRRALAALLQRPPQ